MQYTAIEKGGLINVVAHNAAAFELFLESLEHYLIFTRVDHNDGRVSATLRRL